MNAEMGSKMESGIVIVTGSNGMIGDAVMRRFAGRFDDVVGFDRCSTKSFQQGKSRC